ncbi:alpha/beta fold hydrolase [Roseicyclus persicicus]|uniref:Alpha/beta hydrolase n=1 Tax=Roseicyclus persicicus TaxID=2650661 RepID=A0A7X6GYC0_9RHOB|nr:alpha/beta hydrolase [Roseibacterium persicicum]NKX44626.1 alpha/beta hydrolase [Roseibacterium persicicum]
MTAAPLFRSPQAHLEIEGVFIPYRSVGEGPPVLLAHGVLGDLRSLAPVATELSDTVEAITVTLPALLADRRPTRPFGTAGQRDDLIDLIWSLGRGPVHLVAWSFSAHSAMAVAIDRPELVRSLFLYEPGFPTFVADATDRDAVASDMRAAFAPVETAFGRGDSDTAVRLAIDAAARSPGHCDAQPEAIRAIYTDTAPTLAAIFGQTPPIPLGPEDLARIRCPVTIARGAGTRDCYAIVSDAAARLVPGAAHIVVAGAGHLLPEQDPARFGALLRAHLLSAKGQAGPKSRRADMEVAR